MSDLAASGLHGSATTARGEFARGWRPLLASAVGIGLGMSPLPTFTWGAFAIALVHQYGWARGQILGASILQTASLFLIGPLLGRLTDKIGARPVAMASTLALGVTLCCFSLITANIWTYYAVYFAMAFLSVGTMPTIYAKVISLWYDRKRGMALGLALCTTGISGMLLPIYAQALIGSIGWRGAFVGVGLLPLVIALPCILFFLPKGIGPTLGDTPDSVVEPAVIDGASIGEALRTYRYWLMAILALIAGGGLSGIVYNLVPLLVDRGFTPASAAKLFGLYGLFVVGGRLLSGWLLDKFWAPAVGCVFLLMPCAGALLLVGGGASVRLLALAVVMLALASGSEFDLVAYLTGRYFGRRNFSALYSGQYAFFGIGAGCAPSIFGVVHDVYGSYNSALFVTSALFGASALAILTLGRYPRFASGH